MDDVASGRLPCRPQGKPGEPTYTDFFQALSDVATEQRDVSSNAGGPASCTEDPTGYSSAFVPPSNANVADTVVDSATGEVWPRKLPELTNEDMQRHREEHRQHAAQTGQVMSPSLSAVADGIRLEQEMILGGTGLRIRVSSRLLLLQEKSLVRIRYHRQVRVHML